MQVCKNGSNMLYMDTYAFENRQKNIIIYHFYKFPDTCG